MFIIKRYRFCIISAAIIIAAILLLQGCKIIKNPDYAERRQTKTHEFSRDAAKVDFSALTFTPWDIDAAAISLKRQDKKPYTLMIYMNGSDLESENGAATKDLVEMLNSGVDTSLVNIVIFTGGTTYWRNNLIPAYECVLWKLEDGGIEEISKAGLINMGDPGTLSGFIDFCTRFFPADKCGLIFWDHGGGSIAGYGHDEIFNNSRLTLLELNYAFEKSGLRDNKLAFLGFDACLMATVEMAVVASDYAEYLVASEDLEPGDGWDYNFLSVFNEGEPPDGAQIGMAVADYYMTHYGRRPDSSLTISVTELEYANSIMGALGNLMERCKQDLLKNQEPAFTLFAQRRYRTKTFGNASRRDNDCDMVDIGDMAHKLSDIYAEETADLLAALNSAVIYNRHNSRADLGGLTAYYIFGGKDDAEYALKTYVSLNMSEEYTEYLLTFTEIMGGESIENKSQDNAGMTRSFTASEVENLLDTQITAWKKSVSGIYCMTCILSLGSDGDANVKSPAEYGGLWPAIDGVFVCMTEISTSVDGTFYAVSAAVNGEDAEVVILISDEYPEGKVMGLRKEDGYVIQKGLDELKDGDKLSFYYQIKDFGGKNSKEAADDDWQLGDEITVSGSLSVEWLEPNENFYYSFLLRDVRQNEYYTELIKKSA